MYTRQNKLRVIPCSKQCNSIFSKLPGLISISDCYNNLTDDTLGLDEQFPVKIFFSKSLIFEISKIFMFNPKSLNFYFLWLINHFSIRLVKRALINSFLRHSTSVECLSAIALRSPSALANQNVPMELISQSRSEFSVNQFTPTNCMFIYTLRDKYAIAK